MFGIGAQEMVIIGLLALLVFGPRKLPQMARELGEFARKARSCTEELKSEVVWESQMERRVRRRERHEQGTPSPASTENSTCGELSGRTDTGVNAETDGGKSRSTTVHETSPDGDSVLTEPTPIAKSRLPRQIASQATNSKEES